MKIMDDLFAYPWTDMFENNCNSYYIGGDAKMLIDPGLTRFFPELLKRLSKDGIESADIENVFLTHSHPDHFEAVEAFLEVDGVNIVMSRAEADFLENVGLKFYPAFGLDIPQYRIDRFIEDGTVKIGGVQFEAYITPGHSPGSVCLYWPEKKVLVSGDLIFYMNVGRTDFPGGNSALLKESIERVSKLDVEYLLPGHMQVVAGKGEIERNFEMVKKSVFPYL
ncbi:MAG: MBL fold metallo-hydrolase [Deltaproteobacteria bacterium]|uniref:MBL fold metallo-hydrolase n=1 Tax=Candidatus Zymogenus saltonus TaxID=2844893 RepID=A0A9D8KDK7_9DELT|nr:MBL fold metallo-hydrolase [Candidatus Zymogenus saltonus]